MKGFYVYYIRHGAGEKKIETKGIDPVRGRLAKGAATTVSGRSASNGVEFGGKISVIPFKDIEAVVSDVDFPQFNEKKIEDKLQEDIKWAERNVQRHHGIVAEAYKIETVIPMKFGTIFKTRKSLGAMLEKHYKKFKKLLAGLSGKQEWGVKGYLEYEKFVEFLKKENKEVKKKEDSKLAMSKGAQWYADKKIDELIAEELEEEIEKLLQRITKRLEDCCEQMVLCDLLPKEATAGMNKDNIFNAACLVRNDALGNFKSLFQELAAECETTGIALIMTGPWPPYNFVEIKK